MYVASVTLLMFVFPIISIVIEVLVNKNHAALIELVGKWFIFWGVGIRFLTVGIRQIFKPELTAEGIFGIKDKKSLILVQELGFATFSIGVLATLTIFNQSWLLPTSIVGGLFFGLAGIRHIFKKRNFEENIATYSDLFIFLVMLIYFVWQI
jgi:hypothetical protein